MPVRRIDHILIAMPAGREEEARAFYCGVLGMTEKIKPPVLAARVQKRLSYSLMRNSTARSIVAKASGPPSKFLAGATPQDDRPGLEICRFLFHSLRLVCPHWREFSVRTPR